MKTFNKLATVALLAVLGGSAAADNKPAATAASTLKEIEGAFGFVPGFIKSLPSAYLPAFWAGLTSLEMNPATKLDGKTKELIGLAVAAATPCEYCIYFHTEAARLDGATDQEIQEAVAMAGQTKLGSTILNGMQIDKQQFKSDIQRIVRTAKSAQSKK